MNKKALLIGASTLLLLATPVFAQTPTASESKPVVACNQTYKNAVKDLETQFKNKTITKEQRNTKTKELQKTHVDCVKSAVSEKKTLKKEAIKEKVMKKKAEVKQRVMEKKAQRKTSKTPTTTP